MKFRLNNLKFFITIEKNILNDILFIFTVVNDKCLIIVIFFFCLVREFIFMYCWFEFLLELIFFKIFRKV